MNQQDLEYQTIDIHRETADEITVANKGTFNERHYK